MKFVQKDLLELDFSDINEYFKRLKDEEDGGSYQLLPDFEKIVSEAKKIPITYFKVIEILTIIGQERGVDMLQEGPIVKPVMVRPAVK